MKERTKKLISSAFRGKLLLGLGIDKYLPQILFSFVMAMGFIWVNIEMENTIHVKERNKMAIEDLKSIYTKLKCDLTSLNSVCKVEEMLDMQNSDVKLPEKQAEWIR